MKIAHLRHLRWFAIILLALLIAPIALAQPLLNEVMPYNHSIWGDDWVELYNPTNETVQLIDWKVTDSSGTLRDITVNVPAGGFAIIVDDNTGCARFNISDCVEIVQIGNGLNKAGDAVFLYDNASVLVDNFSWSYDLQASGKSWSRCPDGGDWSNSTTTPGSANNCTSGGEQTNVALAIAISQAVAINTSHELFNISIDGKSCSVSDNVTIGYNITSNGSAVEEGNVVVAVNCTSIAVNWVPNATGEHMICGWIINSTTNNTDSSDDAVCANVTVVGEIALSCDLAISVSAIDVLDLGFGSTLKYNITISDGACNGTPHSIDVTYQIDDLFGNNIRSPYTSTASMNCSKILQKTWSNWPDILGSEAYLIKANITSPGCNDTNLSNNYAEKLFAVKGNKSGTENRSQINITTIGQGSNNVSKWGESFDVWLEIYRGDTPKYAVSVYVNGTAGKVSEETTMHAKDKYMRYNVKVPVQLKPNCGSEWPDGNYTLVASGLDLVVTAPVSIAGTSNSACKTVVGNCPSSGSGGGGGVQCAEAVVQETSAGEDSNFFFVQPILDKVSVGQKFNATVHIRNNASIVRNFTVYSHVFDGNRLISEGTWTANANTIELGPGEETNMTLANKIKASATPGVYKFRVRIKGVKDITSDISITDAEMDEIYYAEQTPNVTTYNDTNESSIQVFNRTRRTITRPDPLEVFKTEAGMFVTGLATSIKVIAGAALEYLCKTGFANALRTTSMAMEAFISRQL